MDGSAEKKQDGRICFGLDELIYMGEGEGSEFLEKGGCGGVARGRKREHGQRRPPPLQPQRRLWVKDRSRDWWERCDSPEFPANEFRDVFRMSKPTFNFICDVLDPVIMKKNTALREAIPTRHRVAVCIWRLATGEPLRSVADRFGLGISTCHKLIMEVCSAMKTVLMPRYLRWPDHISAFEIKSGFERISGIRGVIGAMRTMHVPIAAPKANAASYLNSLQTERNQKSTYTVAIQGVVDCYGVFLDASIGWPGSMNDGRVFERSEIGKRVRKGETKGSWIVGGQGHPLTDGVLVPYVDKNVTWTQHLFNERTVEVDKVAEGAFQRLKSRWGCLRKRTEVRVQDVAVVLGACCVLHNVCELRGEKVEEEWMVEVSENEAPNIMGWFGYTRGGSASAVRARDRIAHDLLHHGP
ncbi:hypothetical protein MLD38_006922 [Melastoma candidum]|uniref:Uncharacterized protein n=1 Tax=Melastoma candidum TaxID=119954 RepID=A0ACB9RRC2_9MYRT|nr:hypothetical protein MLD38_006922 [Melastoma candidum]